MLKAVRRIVSRKNPALKSENTNRGMVMKIKDVENRTGLTAKSIRFYETKGLIRVGRQPENDYRDYTEENVQQLMKIKLLRYLEFTVEEIRELLESQEAFDGETNACDGGANASGGEAKNFRWQLAMEKKAAYFSEQQQSHRQKQELCLALAKDGQQNDPRVVEEYNCAIEFLENEVEEFRGKMLDLSCPSISVMVIETLILLGPVLWLFLNIHLGRKDILMANAVGAIAATALLAVLWKNYLSSRKLYKERMKKRNRQHSHVIPVMIVGIVGILEVFVLFTAIQEWVFCSGSWLFFEINPKFQLLLIICLMGPVLFFLLFLVSLWRNRGGKRREETEETGTNQDIFSLEEEYTLAAEVYLFFLRHKLPVLALWLLLLYVCFTSVTVVTPDSIVFHSPFCPQGQTYSYSQVEQAEASFGKSGFTIFHYKRKGEFSYTIHVDGHNIVFAQPNVNEEIERYGEDSYLELEEFDEKLMALGVEKVGDERYSKDAILDERYVQRFLRIIRRKPL